MFTENIRTINLAEELKKSEPKETDFKVEEESSIDFFANIEGKEPEKEAEPEREPEAEKPVNYIGEAFRAYIIIEYDKDRLMFIDKHAAHERLIYEQLKKDNSSTSPQMLLEPITVTLDKEEYSTVLENKEAFMQAGFDST